MKSIVVDSAGPLDCSPEQFASLADDVTKMVDLCGNHLFADASTEVNILVMFDLANSSESDKTTIVSSDSIGSCEQIGDNTYLILVSTTDRWTALETIAHEMVHVKQFVTGELSIEYECVVGPTGATNPTAYVVFKGVKYNIPEEPIDYCEMPHEIEAYGRECTLMHRFEQLYPSTDGDTK